MADIYIPHGDIIRGPFKTRAEANRAMVEGAGPWKPANSPDEGHKGEDMTITETSLELFLGLARDAGNWSGTPMADVTAQERGNLTQLKRAGLLKTYTDEGVPFAYFTEAGVALAAEHGVDIAWCL